MTLLNFSFFKSDTLQFMYLGYQDVIGRNLHVFSGRMAMDDRLCMQGGRLCIERRCAQSFYFPISSRGVFVLEQNLYHL